MLAGALAAACGSPPASSVAPTMTPAASTATPQAPPPVASSGCSTFDAPGPKLDPNAGTEARDSATVVRIDVRGYRRIPLSDICAYLSTRAGRPFDREGVDRDVKELWKTGLFDDVEVDRAISGAGVRLMFSVRERALVARVTIHGATAVPEAEIRDRVSVRVGSAFDPVSVRESVAKLRAHYEQRGYRKAQIDFRVEPSDSGQVAVDLAIVEGSPVTLRAWTFRGAAQIPEATLRGAMSTEHGQFNAVGGIYRPDLFERDRMMILALYYDRGMLEASIAPEDVKDAPNEKLDVAVPIHEGRVYRIGKLRFEGTLHGPEAQYRAMLGLKEGDVFNRSIAVQGLEKIRAFQKQSDPNAQAEPLTEMDPSKGIVDVTVQLAQH